MKKKLKISFEADPSVNEVEVIVRARERDGEIDALIERITEKAPETLTVTDADGALIKLSPADVVLVSVSGKLVEIVTESERFTVRQPLHEFEQKLEAGRFVRISRYEIVNLDKVKRFDFTLGGTLRLELVGGMETWASRRNIPMIRKKLTKGE